MSSLLIIKANQYRTHTCGELAKKHVGQRVRLSGWVHARRDHGGLIFIDLRDRWGITQLTFNPKEQTKAWQVAETLRSEYVIKIEGEIVARPEAMVNKEIDTGEIEVVVETIAIETQSEPLPFAVAQDGKVNEETRLKYRFLDLRHPRLQGILKQRDALLTYIRQYFHEKNFIEVQTPILANSSPEGARDYLVPSRLYPGSFYALPQAPQQFKQLLMVAGLDRYFQIAPCFRDEDPRADRHPGEFYQLDLEMSFVEQEDIFNIIEPLMVELTEKFSAKKIIVQPFPRISWREAMTRYGTDKPDLRFDLLIHDVSADVAHSDLKIFTQALKDGGVVHALHVPEAADMSRSEIEKLTQLATESGLGGLAYVLFKDKTTSSVSKFFSEEALAKLLEKVGGKKGAAIFLGAGPWLKVCKALGTIRNHLGEQRGLKDPNKAAWCWIVDFPMYEWNEAEGKIDFSHNPFSMPQGGMAALDAEDPTTILAYQYDIVCNGYEISSGAIRNHQPEIMYRVFAKVGYSRQDVDAKFGGLLRAFRYGAPPHGGIAPGVDRLMMVLWDLPSIRDIYAFPKNGRAQDLLMGAPAPVSQKQLAELHIKVVSPKVVSQKKE